ncbi:Nudix family hydrolase [Solilutibacter tolerans]|uniref:Nudix family hydrolase n=1 Tax=Solilutibacter tolerans TaxID=1604334 RepID=UPI000970B1E4|nr:Nudix family hydrolase [Lysobacter tolerans]
MPDNTPPIHVMAGVVTDVRGRVLLARRTQGRDLAGLWEFPGGKVDPGETPEEALARELQEELGIDADIGEPLIRVPQQMPHKRIVLDVRHVPTHRGHPRGLDGQALAWVPRDKLPRYAMPPADRPVVAALLQAERYLVTPSPYDMSDDAWLAALDAALATGIRRVQLRAPDVGQGRWRTLAAEAVARCRIRRAEILINGDEALAMTYGVGLHLRAEQLKKRRKRDFPDDLRLAASCHDAHDLKRAEMVGCDFVVLGAVNETASHPGQPGMGWARFAALRECTSLPIYAIGGLGMDAMADARQQGAQGIAAIRALWPQGPSQS